MVFEHQGEYRSQWAAMQLDRSQVRDDGRDASQLGPPGRDRPRPAAGLDERGAGQDQGARARESRSCAGRTRSSRRPRFSSRGSSTRNRRSDERLHRRAPRPYSGSSRSAGRCSSPRRRITRARNASAIPALAPCATASCWPRSAGSMRRTSRSTAPGRSGGSCSREGIAAPRCTVERLMRADGLRGAIRGGKRVRTTIPRRTRLSGPQISSTATSPRPPPTTSGSPTSPTWRPGRRPSTSPS